MAESRSTRCTLSSEPLRDPIVADRIGNLYNKEIILEKLVEKTMPRGFCYIRKMKDIYEINSDCVKKSTFNDEIHCPISDMVYNGVNKMVLIRECGCVFSEKALVEMNTSAIARSKCPHCSKPYSSKPIILVKAPE